MNFLVYSNNMETKIIDGRKIRNQILEGVKREVEALPFSPLFCDILVGNDAVSASYVNIKAKTALSVGIKFKTVQFNGSATTEEIVEEIENLNKVPHICGIIIQLPLPSHIDKRKVLDTIDPRLDVDCLGSFNSEDFYNDIDGISYPTALACMHSVDSLDIELKDKKDCFTKEEINEELSTLNGSIINYNEYLNFRG